MNADNLPRRLRERIDMDGPVPAHAPEMGKCWIWTGATTKGYGKVFWKGQMRTAHRVCFSVLVKEPVKRSHVDHLCRNPPCCNPAHLEEVSMRENIARAIVLVTHCKRGHERTPENSRKTYGGCRLCQNIRQRSRYATDLKWRAARKKDQKARVRELEKDPAYRDRRNARAKELYYINKLKTK